MGTMANYVDLVVHGDDRDLIPYLNGFLAGSGEPVRIVFAAEAGFHIRELRERIHYRGEVHHVVVEAAKAPLVRQALNAAAPRYRFKVEAEHAFERSRFQFEFDTPSRSVAGELKQTLTKLPPGLELSGYQPRETTDPGASATEVYAPDHDYRFAGRGVLRGGPFAVVDVRARLCTIDFVKCGEIEIDD
jgi:hypothetical protein